MTHQQTGTGCALLLLAAMMAVVVGVGLAAILIVEALT